MINSASASLLTGDQPGSPVNISCESGRLSPEGEAVGFVNRNSSLLARPLFLVGSERSGTTLTRLMLDYHPKIAFFFEFPYSVDMMCDRDGWPDLHEYYAYSFERTASSMPPIWSSTRTWITRI